MPLNFPVLYKSMDIRAESVIAQAIQSAISDAEQLWTPEKFDGPFATKGFGIRKMTAADFSKNGTAGWTGWLSTMWGVSIAQASTWSEWISAGVTLSDSCYFVICGFFNYDATPDIEAIKVTADGIEYPVTDLSEMNGWDIATAWSSHPIVVRPEKGIRVQLKARTAGQKHFGLLGYTIGKRSYLITAL